MVTHFARNMYQFIDVIHQVHRNHVFSAFNPYPVVFNVLDEKPVEIRGFICHTELATEHLAPVCDLEELEEVAAIAMAGLAEGRPVLTRCAHHSIYWIRADLVGKRTN